MHGRTPWERCLGGSESALIFVARALAARGHHVEVFTKCEAPGVYDDVTYRDLADLDLAQRMREWDVFVSLRFPDLVMRDIHASIRVLWCQDVIADFPVRDWLAWADRLVFVSEWHRQTTVRRHPAIAPCAAVIENPVCTDLVGKWGGVEREADPVLLHLSRPERGLLPLLEAWPRILASVPRARLRVARYRSFHEPRGSEVEAFCQMTDEQVAAMPGASHLGHLSKPALYEALSRATLMVYPAVFDETSCIAAIESQACGLPVVGVRRGALPETLSPDASVLVEPGPGMVADFADAVIDLLHDPARRARMSRAGRQAAERFAVDTIAHKWEEMFAQVAQGRLGSSRPARAALAWPGWSAPLQRRIRERLIGARRIGVLGPENAIDALIGGLSGADVARLAPFVAPEGPPLDAVLDAGAILQTEDRAGLLAWMRTLVPPEGRLVWALPQARTDAERPRRPSYDDVLHWFGEKADIDVTLEREAPWSLPARCWIVQCSPQDLRGADRAPARRLARPMPTVSACLIVRDAEATVLNALTSLAPIADELCIVDTGSVDATLEVVDAYVRRAGIPARVRQIAWPDDFAAARNASMEGASGDWIFWLDADERLIGGERLRRLLQSELFEAYAIRQHNHIFDRGVTQVEIPFRVFRNGRDYRFYGAVHEHPEARLNVSIEPWMIAPDVEILHDGYLSEATRVRKLLQRNLRLLQLDFEKYPGRLLGDILYLRDCVNLAQFDLREHKALRSDHRDATLAAVERFEAVHMASRDRYYHLGRPYYDQALRLLGQGHDLTMKFGGPDAPQQEFRVRLTSDAQWLALDAAQRFVQARIGGDT